MGVIQKQSISGVIWSYLGVGLGFITTAILFTRILETDQIGLIRLLLSYSSIVAMFASLGINTVAIKMFPQFRDEKKKHHGFLGLSLMVGLVGFVLSTLVYLLLKDVLLEGAEEKSALFIPFFYAVVPLTLFTVIYGILDSYFRMLFNAVKGIAYKEVYQRILIIVAIIFYYFQIISFTTFVYCYIAAYLIPMLFFLITLIHQKKFYIKIDFSFFTPILKKEMVSVALFGILASFSGILVQSIDIIMINDILGLTDTGIYTISFFFGTLILIPFRTMTRIGSVVISEAWKNNNKKTIAEVYTKSSLTLSVLGLLFFIGIWGNIENVFQLIGEQFSTGRYVILFIALANLTESSTGMSAQIIGTSVYYKWLTYLLVIFSAVIVITNFIFIPIYGIMGAALASFIAKSVYNLMKLFFIKMRFGIQPFTPKHLILVAIAVAAWYISTFIPVFSNYLIDIVIRSAALSILFLVPVYFFRISDDLNQKAEGMLNEAFRFIKK